MENFQPNHHSSASETGDWEQGIINNHPMPLELSAAEANATPPLELSAAEANATPKTLLLIYLIPVIGFFPSLWTLYRRQGSREQLAASRLSITLAFTWFLGYLLLATGAETSDFFALRLLILNSFLTSGYFLVSIWLIFRILQGKSKRFNFMGNNEVSRFT